MKKNINNYWMYSKYAINSALCNPNRRVVEFLVEDKLIDFYKDFLNKNNIRKKFPIRKANKAIILKKIGSFAKYQGVALLVEKLSAKKNDFLKNNIHNQKLILIIDQLNDPFNFGSLCRVSYAFGLENIIILDRFMPEENALISSIASGSLDKLNIFKVSNLINVINHLNP